MTTYAPGYAPVGMPPNAFQQNPMAGNQPQLGAMGTLFTGAPPNPNWQGGGDTFNPQQSGGFSPWTNGIPWMQRTPQQAFPWQQNPQQTFPWQQDPRQTFPFQPPQTLPPWMQPRTYPDPLTKPQVQPSYPYDQPTTSPVQPSDPLVEQPRTFPPAQIPVQTPAPWQQGQKHWDMRKHGKNKQGIAGLMGNFNGFGSEPPQYANAQQLPQYER